MSSQDTRDSYPRIGGHLVLQCAEAGVPHYDYRLERLIARLPARCQRAVRWLRRPSARWARIPAGILLVLGGCLAILPIFGLWMIPLGLILLAEDMPLLRRLRGRALDWVERSWPQVFAHPAAPNSDKEETR
jgi:hypothetical protein